MHAGTSFSGSFARIAVRIFIPQRRKGAKAQRKDIHRGVKGFIVFSLWFLVFSCGIASLRK